MLKTPSRECVHGEFRPSSKEDPGRISSMSRALVATLTGCLLMLLGTMSAHAQPAFQGFETNTGDWTDITAVPGAGIARVPSGGGVLHVSSAAGSFHAQLERGLLGGLGQHVEYRDQARARMAGKIACMHAPNAATAEHCDTNHLVSVQLIKARVGARRFSVRGSEIRSRVRW